MAQIESIFSGIRRFAIRHSEPFGRLGPLAEGWFLSPKAASRLRPLTHTSFVYLPSVDELKVDTAKLDSPNAAYLRSQKKLQKNLTFL